MSSRNSRICALSMLAAGATFALSIGAAQAQSLPANSNVEFGYQSEFGKVGRTERIDPLARRAAQDPLDARAQWDTDLSWDRPVTPLDPRVQGNGSRQVIILRD